MNSVTRVSVAKSQSHVWRCLFALTALSVLTTAQAAPPTIELFALNNTTGLVAGNTGPTSAAATNTYSLNSNNPNDDAATTFSPNTTITYTINQSVYNSSTWPTGNTGTAADNQRPDFNFGGRDTDTNNDNPTLGRTTTAGIIYALYPVKVVRKAIILCPAWPMRQPVVPTVWPAPAPMAVLRRALTMPAVFISLHAV